MEREYRSSSPFRAGATRVLSVPNILFTLFHRRTFPPDFLHLQQTKDRIKITNTHARTIPMINPVFIRLEVEDCVAEEAIGGSAIFVKEGNGEESRENVVVLVTLDLRWKLTLDFRRLRMQSRQHIRSGRCCWRCLLET